MAVASACHWGLRLVGQAVHEVDGEIVEPGGPGSPARPGSAWAEATAGRPRALRNIVLVGLDAQGDAGEAPRGAGPDSSRVAVTLSGIGLEGDLGVAASSS